MWRANVYFVAISGIKWLKVEDRVVDSKNAFVGEPGVTSGKGKEKKALAAHKIWESTTHLFYRRRYN